VTKQALAQRDSELKRVKQKVAQLEDRQKVQAEASTTTDTKLATAHVERDNAMRTAQKAQAELQLRLAEIEALERRVALLVGDAGVAPEDLERALAMVRDAGRPTVASTTPDQSGLRLQDTDLNALGLSPLAKKQVQEILIQNSELIMQLEKTEQLLKIAQKMCAHRRS
jgi:membrane carboxypeptidase/penicillin-binding protein PbpC